MQIKAMTTA